MSLWPAAIVLFGSYYGYARRSGTRRPALRTVGAAVPILLLGAVTVLLFGVAVEASTGIVTLYRGNLVLPLATSGCMLAFGVGTSVLLNTAMKRRDARTRSA